jgi:type IV pilus assembly protein PilC
MATLTYEYKVRDRSGAVKTGKLDAESPSQVASKLKSMGYAPLSINQSNAGMGKEIRIFGKPKIKRRTSPSSRGSSPR